MRHRVKRRRQVHGDLDITAFMNLMVILVPFLLITAVFSRITLLDLNLPEAGQSAKVDKNLMLEVIVRPSSIEVADRDGGLIKRLPDIQGEIAQGTLVDLLKALKGRYPETRSATVLVEQNIPYHRLVTVMDSVRMLPAKREGGWVFQELFPEISLGDAPERRASLAEDGRT